VIKLQTELEGAPWTVLRSLSSVNGGSLTWAITKMTSSLVKMVLARGLVHTFKEEKKVNLPGL
jgi:hypothetical protein